MRREKSRRSGKDQSSIHTESIVLEVLEPRVLLDGGLSGEQALMPYIDMFENVSAGNVVGFTINDVAIGPGGDIYVGGVASNYTNDVDKGDFDHIVRPHSGDQDGFIAKFSEEGDGLWVSYIGGSDNDNIEYLDVDASGNVWVAGGTYSYDDFPGYEDAPYGGNFMAKFSGQGTLLWTDSMGISERDEVGSDNSYSIVAAPKSINFDSSGVAYGLAYISQRVEGESNDYFGVAGFDSSGTMYEASRFSYSSYDLPNSYLDAVEVISPTRVFVISPSKTSEAYNHAFDVLLLTPDSFSITATISGYATDTTLDSQGNLLVAGRKYNGNSEDYDGFVAKINPSGQLLWNFDIAGSNGDTCYAIAADSQDNVYFGGESSSYDDFPFVNSISTDPTVFMGALSPTGQVLFNSGLADVDGKWYGSSHDSGIDVDEDGIVYAYDGIDWDNNRQALLTVVRVGTEAGDDLPEASLESDFIHDGSALITDINAAGYLDIRFEDTNPKTVNGNEFVLSGDGAENVSLKGKPTLVDKDENIFRYTMTGAFDVGSVTLQYASGTFVSTDGRDNVATTELFNVIPDISPLQFSVDTSEFEWDEDEEGFVYEGDVGIGLKPAEGQSFIPLVTVVDGSVSFDKNAIYGEGMVNSPVMTAGAVDLFEGNFEIKIGQAQTYYVEDNEVVLTGGLIVAGLDCEVTQFSFPAADRLYLQGEINLPTQFGAAQIAVNGSHNFSLSRVGFGITGGTLKVPDIDIDLPYLNMKASDMSVEFVGETIASGTTPAKPSALRFRGKVVLPDVFDATAEFVTNPMAGTDGYIEINGNGEFKWYGKLSVANIVIVPDLWEIKEASLEVRDVPGVGMSVQGDGKAVVPPGMEIICGLGFVNEEFNYIKLGVGDLNIPIATTGAYLQEITGSINNMADPDATKIVFGGGVGFTAGPKVGIHLPDWAGGDLEGSLAEFGIEGGFNMSELTGTGTMKMVNGLVEGTAVAALNWDKGTLNAKCNLKALNNLLTIDGTMKADSNMNVNVTGQGLVTLPSIVPLWGGRQIAGGNSMLVYVNDTTYSNDFVAGWGSVSISVFGKVRHFTAGLKVNFDGSYSFLGSKEVARTLAGTKSIAGPVTLGAQDDAQVYATKASETETVTYTVEDGAEWLMVDAQWDNNADATITLIGPDGTVYDQDDFANSDKVAIVTELSSGNAKVLFVESPEAGYWQLKVESPQALNNLKFGGYQDSELPELTIDDVLVNQYADTATIDYSSQQDLSGYQPAFYYDDDNSGADGILIGLDDGDGKMTWNIENVGAGTYYVYASLYDESNVPVSTYYDQQITILDTPPVTEVAIGNGGAKKVTYSDQDGTIVTVAVKSDSGVLQFAGDDIVVTDNRGNVVVSGEELFLQGVVLDGFGEASVSFAAKGGQDNEAFIGAISGGSIKALAGKGVVLTGNIDVQGSLASMKWGDIDNNLVISTTVASAKGFSLKAGNIGENVVFEIMDTISSFSANQYSSGEVVGNDIIKLAVKQGDFDVDVYTLLGDIQSLSTGGDILGDVYSAGGIGSVATKGDIAGYIIAEGEIKKVAATTINDGGFYATQIGSIASKNNINAVVVTTTGNLGSVKASGDIDIIADVAGSIVSLSTKGNFDGLLRAAGNIDKISANDMVDSALSAGSNIGTVSLKGDMDNSWIMAGYDLGDDLTFSNDDIPGSGDIKSVSVSGTFSESYLLAGVLPDLGFLTSTGASPYIGNSGSIQKVKFGAVDYTSNEIFGVFAAGQIKPFKIGRDTAVSTGDYFKVKAFG